MKDERRRSPNSLYIEMVRPTETSAGGLQANKLTTVSQTDETGRTVTTISFGEDSEGAHVYTTLSYIVGTTNVPLEYSIEIAPYNEIPCICYTRVGTRVDELVIPGDAPQRAHEIANLLLDGLQNHMHLPLTTVPELIVLVDSPEGQNANAFWNQFIQPA